MHTAKTNDFALKNGTIPPMAELTLHKSMDFTAVI
jgi:hypothetical protein